MRVRRVIPVTRRGDTHGDCPNLCQSDTSPPPSHCITQARQCNEKSCAKLHARKDMFLAPKNVQTHHAHSVAHRARAGSLPAFRENDKPTETQPGRLGTPSWKNGRIGPGAGGECKCTPEFRCSVTAVGTQPSTTQVPCDGKKKVHKIIGK